MMAAEELNSLQKYFASLQFWNYADIIVLLILMGVAYHFLHNTRAMSVVKGLLVLVLLFLFVRWSNLSATTYVLEKVLYVFLIAGAVMLVPELRRVLERIGNINILRGGSKLTRAEIDDVLDATRDTVANLSRRKVGALIVFEQNSSLDETVDSGIKLDAYISSGLLINIFEKNTPLHDGAVVVRENKVLAATCYLPLTDQHLSKDLGTRHRAALGLTEQSDALVVIVSEETGNISVARDGQLLRYLTPNDVEALLVENLYKTNNKTDLMKVVSKSYN
ncbi:MAG: diadenylate cyclase CdaA [Phascolarctobacterium sp.]|nr:diadenylate cyclase CdaA [Candidatus Phascolarctobacterium caballi]